MLQHGDVDALVHYSVLVHDDVRHDPDDRVPGLLLVEVELDALPDRRLVGEQGPRRGLVDYRHRQRVDAIVILEQPAPYRGNTEGLEKGRTHGQEVDEWLLRVVAVVTAFH